MEWKIWRDDYHNLNPTQDCSGNGDEAGDAESFKQIIHFQWLFIQLAQYDERRLQHVYLIYGVDSPSQS